MSAKAAQKAAPSATQQANPFTGFAAQSAGSPPAPGSRALALAFALLGAALLLAALAGAWLQPLRSLPRVQTDSTPADLDWWAYPLESNAALRLPAIQGNLRGVFALADAKRVWAVGTGGLILHSPDGGNSWQQQHPKPAAKMNATVGVAWPELIDSARAALPSNQKIPPEWQQNALPNLPPEQRSIQQAPATKGEPANANAPAEPIQKTAPPVQQFSKEPLPSRTASVPAKKPPVAKVRKPVAPAATAAKPAPKTAVAPPGDDVDLYAVFFLDANNGWAAGEQGMVWRTRDGSASWQAGFVGERVRLVRVRFDAGFVLATGADGRSFRSSLGADDWRTNGADAAAGLVQANETRTAAGWWQAGAQGLLRSSRDRGQTWQPRPSGTHADLAGIAFADARHGWAVGDIGTILHSNDGGQTWRALTGGEHALAARNKGETNHRKPAPWTWLALLLGIGLLSAGARNIRLAAGPTAEQTGIAGLFVSDQPLKPGDTDHLGHANISRGLADFIRNRNTEPGLTLAVTGSWGSGKSSIMRLLEDDLKRAGFRPAWFNAWHHQQEGRQLASMFNTIRHQAVPPIQLPAAWRVRALLYWNRGWLYRLLAFGLIGLVLLGLFETQGQEAPLTQLRQSVIGALIDVRPVVLTGTGLDTLRKGGVLQPATLATLSANMVWQPRPAAGEGCREIAGESGGGDCRFDNIDQLYASLNRALAPASLTDEERQALAAAVQHLGDSQRGMFGVLLALLIPLLLGKGLAVYGLNYLDILKRVLPDRGKVEGKEAVGTMESFRTEFCHLTQALDGRLVLFIDDLDRCDCATVREVLELVNYLVSVGRCFVVLGMAMEHVACCIEPKCKTQQSDGYAMQYLKKLVNIEVPVPKAALSGIRAMLEGQAKTGERPPDSEPARRWATWTLSLVLLAVLTWSMQRTWTQWTEVQPKTFQTAAPLAAPAVPSGRDAAVATAPASTAPAAIEAEPPAAAKGPVGLLPPQQTTRLGWTVVLSLLALVALAAAIVWPTRARWLDWLHRHGILRAIRIGLGGVERKRDTPAFIAALEGWHAVIVAGDPTPRGIKRFVNRVRFLAMMEQALESDQIPEGVLVGLAALHHAKIALPEDITGLSDAAEWRTSQSESLDPTESQALFEAIETAIQTTPDWPPTREHSERFLHMVEYMHVR